VRVEGETKEQKKIVYFNGWRLQDTNKYKKEEKEKYDKSKL